MGSKVAAHRRGWVGVADHLLDVDHEVADAVMHIGRLEREGHPGIARVVHGEVGRRVDHLRNGQVVREGRVERPRSAAVVGEHSIDDLPLPHRVPGMAAATGADDPALGGDD